MVHYLLGHLSFNLTDYIDFENLKFFQEFLLIPRDLHSQDFLCSQVQLPTSQAKYKTQLQSLMRVHFHIKALVSNAVFTKDIIRVMNKAMCGETDLLANSCKISDC